MKTSNEYNSSINDPRGNDQTREKSQPGNDKNTRGEMHPFPSNEPDPDASILGEISASSGFGDESEGLNEKMARINRESEIQRGIRQNAGNPNIHHFKSDDHKQDTSMWD